MKKIITTGLLLLASQAYADVNVEALQACSMIENNAKRLTCYDKIMGVETPKTAVTVAKPEHVPVTPAHFENSHVKPVAWATVKAEKPSQPVAPAAATNANSQSEFGLEHKVKEEAGDELVAVVASLKQSKHNGLTLTLENGQTWRQIGSDSFKLKTGDTVVISRAMFNSFLMKKQGQNRSIRVKRVD